MPRGFEKTTIPPEQTGAAVDAQPETGNAADGFPIVGIGASARGIIALEAFFSGLPTDADPGMAFVWLKAVAGFCRAPD